jgi:hypothetical protein
MNNKQEEEIRKLVDENRKNGNGIYSYFHCNKCCDEDLYQNIGLGWTPLGIQVWCESYNENILHLDFCGQKVEVV